MAAVTPRTGEQFNEFQFRTLSPASAGLLPGRAILQAYCTAARLRSSRRHVPASFRVPAHPTRSRRSLALGHSQDCRVVVPLAHCTASIRCAALACQHQSRITDTGAVTRIVSAPHCRHWQEATRMPDSGLGRLFAEPVCVGTVQNRSAVS